MLVIPRSRYNFESLLYLQYLGHRNLGIHISIILGSMSISQSGVDHTKYLRPFLPAYVSIYDQSSSNVTDTKGGNYI